MTSAVVTGHNFVCKKINLGPKFFKPYFIVDIIRYVSVVFKCIIFTSHFNILASNVLVYTTLIVFFYLPVSKL